MEVREPDARYLTAVQRTELGEFPADWQVVPLDEFDPFITSGSRGWAAYYADIGSTFLRITNLSRSCIYPSLRDLRYVAVPPDNSEGVRTALRAGDVLISITADIGIVGLVTEAVELPAYINQHIALVRFDESEVNSRYIAYFLAGAAAQRRFKSMTDAGAKAGMNLAGVRDVLAALPPSTDEQAAIADALTDTDALIDSLEQLLTKKRQIKQGAMQELLTGKRRLLGIAGNWATRMVAEISAKQANATVGGPFGSDLVAKDYVGSGVPVIRGQNMGQAFVSGEFAFVTNDKAKTLQANTAKPHDVIFTQRGTLGQVALVPPAPFDKYLISQSQMKLTVDAAVADAAFVYQYFASQFGQRQILDSAIQTGVPHTNLGILRSYKVPMPELEEQRAIAAGLSDIDAEVAAIESRLIKARALKQAMAQALLTGRIRVVEPTA